MRRAILMDTQEGVVVAFQLKIWIKKVTIKFSSVISQKKVSRQKNGNSDFNGYRGGCQIFIPSAIRRKILPTSYELCFGVKKWSAISRSCLVGRLNDFGQVCRLWANMKHKKIITTYANLLSHRKMQTANLRSCLGVPLINVGHFEWWQTTLPRMNCEINFSYMNYVEWPLDSMYTLALWLLRVSLGIEMISENFWHHVFKLSSYPRCFMKLVLRDATATSEESYGKS